MWVYRLFANDVLIKEYELSGLAWLGFDSVSKYSDYICELHEVWVGDNFDPVLHTTIVHRDGKQPPCADPCPYRRCLGGGFNAMPRPTAFRVEAMDPSDRCGWKPKPNHMGGHDYDYGFCVGKRR